ncbi:MAG: class I SAM-dependent methyltransferase [Candidatus Magnetoovum sp. WYHC-5]|nr:class I SAM-dependent methyltransferase [Candidatus Magnetoovum sp. WYHC-5]
MKSNVCPWWQAYFFDNKLRNLIHSPERLLSKYVKEGMVVLDVGCGMGYFSIGMAKLVGHSGCVISADLQPQMLEVLSKRAQKANVFNNIRPRLCKPDSIEVTESVDFVLAFWMVHEVPNTSEFFRQIVNILKPEGNMLIAEPKIHVSFDRFMEIVAIAKDVGFQIIESPSIRFSRSVLLKSVEGQKG